MKFDLSNRKNFLAVAVAGFLLLVIADVLLYGSMVTSIKRDQEQKKMDELDVQFANRTLQDKLKKAVSFKPLTQENIEEAINRLVKLASQNKVIFGLSDSSQETPKLQHKKRKKKKQEDSTGQSQSIFTARASGSYQNLGDFLAQVRQLPDIFVDIKSVVFTCDQTDASLLQAVMKMELLGIKNYGEK